MRYAFALCALSIMMGLLLTGCSSFKSKKRLDMGRFAEDMIAVAGEIQYSLGQQEPVYLRDYRDTPELLFMEQGAERAKQLIRGVIAYSIQLVTVGDSRKPEHEKAQALAGYLEEVLPPVLDASGPTLAITHAEVDTILANIRSQSKYLDAIGAAQPVIDEIAIASGEIFDELKLRMDAAVDAVRHRIETKYRDSRVADDLLRKRQLYTVYNIAYLPQIRLGVPDAADSLLAREPSLTSLIDVHDGIDSVEAQRIEERMIWLLDNLRAVRDQLAPDIETYYREQRELDQINAVWSAELRKARVSVVAWARAHKRMAQGVTDPAEIDVLGIARKASGKILPLP